MAIKVREIRAMGHDDKIKLLDETRGELMHERGLAAMGGAVKNPGRIRALRRTIARVLTLVREEEIRSGQQLAVTTRSRPEEPAPRARRPGPRAPKPRREETARARPSARVGATKAETAAAKEKMKKGSKRRSASEGPKRTKKDTGTEA